jgi:branched-chain amino acid transport system substrate-binding protein
MYTRLIHLVLGFWLILSFLPGKAFADHRPGNVAVMAGTWSLTGKYVGAGTSFLKGRELYVEQLNERGGLLGHKIELKILDDKSDRRTAIELYEDLITKNAVDIVLGPYTSHIADAVANVMERYKRPFIALGAVSPVIFKRGRKYVFRPISVVSHDYQKGALLLAKQAGVSRIAVIGAETQFNRQVTKGALSWAKEFGLEVVLLENYRGKSTDFTDLIRKIAASGAEAVFTNGFFFDSVHQIRQLHQFDVNVRIISSALAPATPEFIEELGPLSEYVLGFSQWQPNPEQGYAGVKEFIETYRDRFGAIPNYRAARAYAAMQTLEAAANKAGSFDPQKLRDALATIKVDTVMGPWQVDETGFMSIEPTIIQIQNGRRVIVWPPELAESDFLPMPKWKDRIKN